MKYYHFYADGKTIREITWEEYHKISNQDYVSDKPRQIVETDGNFVGIAKGKQWVAVGLQQLQQILKTKEANLQ